MAKADARWQVEAPEWWKHLRPYNKRKFWRRIRQAARQCFNTRCWKDE